MLLAAVCNPLNRTRTLRHPAFTAVTDVEASPLRRVAAALAALLLLNAALSFSTWWPTPGIVPDARLAPEFVGLWLLLLALVAWRGALSARMASVLGLGYLLLVLGRYLDVTVPSLFGRPISLYWDGRHLPRFLWVSAQDLPAWLTLAIVLAALLLLCGLFWLLRRAIVVAARDAVPLALRRRWAWGLTLAALLLAVGNYAGVRATWPLVSKPVVPTYWHQFKLLAQALWPGGADRVLPPSPALEAALTAPAQALGGLRGRDVYLIPLESYGAVAYDDPRAAAALRPARARLAAEIAASGRQVVSAFVRSPTFAGGTDLAHLGVLTGLDLSDPARHDLLLTTQRPTLNTLFRAQGYQSFGIYASTRWEWPERVFYGYDVFMSAQDFDYRGPSLGYWRIPDQVALARFEQLHPRAAGTPPRIVFFGTITCHLPFSPVPPYQSDWRRLLGEQPYDSAELSRALAEQPNWLNMFPDYLRMVDYTYRWLGGFMGEPEPREAVHVWFGDHQPSANVTGEGASWDVPVHIVSRDPRLLARFIAQGFAPGLEPPRAPLGGLWDLTAMLLRGFQSDALHASSSAPVLTPLPTSPHGSGRLP